MISGMSGPCVQYEGRTLEHLALGMLAPANMLSGLASWMAISDTTSTCARVSLPGCMLHACMASFRLGCWTSLAVHAAIRSRGGRGSVRDPSTACRICRPETIEDDKHVAFECPHFEELCVKCNELFPVDDDRLDVHSDLANWLGMGESWKIASYLWEVHCCL